MAARTRRLLNQVASLGADRFAGLPSWVVLIQLFIGLGWLRAVAEKVIDRHWWTGEVIDQFTFAHQQATLSWYRPFLELVKPNAAVLALVVIVGQLIAAVSLTTGRRVGLGIGVGMFLNLHFLATGAVTPSVFYLLAQGVLGLWMAEHNPRPALTRRLRVVAATAIFLAILSLPEISTIDPHGVIDDPAMMFVFGGSLTALACLLANRPHLIEQPAAVSTEPDGGHMADTARQSELVGAFSARASKR